MTSQTAFHAGLADPATPAPIGLIDPAGRPAGRRYNVYRNNVAVSLREALTAGFPATRALIGPQNFDHLARAYQRENPPEHPRMMFYGAQFPAFLSALPALSHLPYLGDVATLEVLLRESYHAADAAPVPPEALSHLPPETLMHSHLTLAPACRTLSSPWPVFSIWRYALDTNAPKPDPAPQDILITRPEFDPVPHVLPKGGLAFIHALSSQTIAQAVDTAQADTPDFDLPAVLGLLLSGHAITGVSDDIC